jgi:hypothetical protein
MAIGDQTLAVGEVVAVWSSYSVRRAVIVDASVPHHCGMVRVRLLDGARLERLCFRESLQRLSGRSDES